jgi:thioredoxin-like negative regulator of GroEL
LEIRFAGALFYKENQMIEECLEQLLAIVKIDKNWQEKKANKEILAIFKELGNSSPLTQTYRRLLQQALH